MWASEKKYNEERMCILRSFFVEFCHLLQKNCLTHRQHLTGNAKAIWYILDMQCMEFNII